MRVPLRRQIATRGTLEMTPSFRDFFASLVWQQKWTETNTQLIGDTHGCRTAMLNGQTEAAPDYAYKVG